LSSNENPHTSKNPQRVWCYLIDAVPTLMKTTTKEGKKKRRKKEITLKFFTWDQRMCQKLQQSQMSMQGI